MAPTVSVVVPTYNHRDYVQLTLNTVFAQTFTDFELIVVNDGSPDNTAELLRPLVGSARFRYLEQPNAGQASARNRGMSEARGEFVAFLDDDDLWPADKLAWQVSFLKEHPEAVGVAGRSCEDWSQCNEMPAAEALLPVARERLFCGNPMVSPGQTLLRSAIVRRIGAFDPNIWGADDLDLWFRLAGEGPLYLGGPIALFYRCHSGNASRDDLRMFLNTMLVFEKHLQPRAWLSALRHRRSAYRYLDRYKGGEFLELLVALVLGRRPAECWSLVRATRAYWVSAAVDPRLAVRILRRVVRLASAASRPLPQEATSVERSAETTV